MMNQPTNLGAITERRIERVLTREDCMELALHQIIMKCDGSDMQTKRIRNIRERAKAGLEGRDPSSPGELGHVPPNHLLMAQLELSGKETDAARAERDALAAELKAVRGDQTPTTEDINLQEWKGMDGVFAFHLIERHADDWNHVARLMNAWLEANREDLVAELKAAREQEPVGWVERDATFDRPFAHLDSDGCLLRDKTNLYAHPVPTRELTMEEVCRLYVKYVGPDYSIQPGHYNLARAIERHMKGEGE